MCYLSSLNGLIARTKSIKFWVLQGNVGLNIVWTKSSNFVQTLFKVCLKYVQIHTLFILCSNTGEKIHTLFNPCSNFFTFVHWLFNTKEMKWAINWILFKLGSNFFFKFIHCSNYVQISNFVQTMFKVKFCSNSVQCGVYGKGY